MNQRLPGEIELVPEEKKALVRDVCVFFEEQLDDENMSEFRAEMLLDFFLRRISPLAYNSAVDDARAFLSEKLEDMEATLFAKAPRD